MNAHARNVLEFDKVVEMLVERTSFEPGAELAVALTPTVDVASIEQALDITGEIRSLMDEGGKLPLEGAIDARRAIEWSTTEGAALGCEELVAVRVTLQVIRSLRDYVAERSDRSPALWSLAEGLHPNKEIEDAIERAVDELALEVRDSASKELGKIRRAMEQTRIRLNEKLQEIIKRELEKDSIQEAAVHMRNGRLVLPVKRASRSKLKGIVHDQSSTGATVFVEPMDTVPLNNELAELTAAEKKEIHRILSALTAMVGAESGAIAHSLRLLGKLDYYRATALLSRDLDAVRPKLNTEGRIGILDGRHPVLAALARKGEAKVVPLNLELGGTGSTLVISGPNAGGKTVTLKTVGLLTMMAQSGLHVPAGADTELSIFRELYADIGDEQSIEMSLSTFSSHLRIIDEILREADVHTLVLMDELGAGTDPDEGASLGIAILEELTDRGVHTIATTHLGTVKTHVHEHEGMANGSMAFDPGTLEPTFRFVSDIPGSSHALSIAETLGLPSNVLERARELRDGDMARIDGLLADLVERGRRLEETLSAVEIERDKARLLTSDYEERLAGVRDERKQIRTGALAEAREILARAQSLVEETVKELRESQAAREAIKSARERLRREKAEVVEELAQEVESPADEGTRPDRLEVGMRVRLAGRVGKLLSLPDRKGKVQVRVKSATLDVAADELREAGVPDVKRAGTPSVTFEGLNDQEPAIELHLRGMTTDDVEDSIDKFLSTAIMQGITVVRIVHGKGTGALRTRTQEVLKGSPAVKSFRLGRWGEGDTGVTVVELK